MTAAQALQNLVTAFQQDPGAIALDAAAFQAAGFATPSTFDTDLAGALLPDGGAAVTLSTASVPAPDGLTLTFSGTATVGLLGMTSAPLWVQVTAVDGGDDAPTAQLLVGFTGLDAAGWALGTSFASLQLSSLADLGTAGAGALFSPTGRVLLYATDAVTSFTLSALSASYSAGVTVPVAAGLNYFATCTTPQSGAWPVLGAIESLSPPDTFLLAGTLDPSVTQGSAPAAYPVVSLSGTLGTSTVQLGGLGVTGPVLDISVTGSVPGQQAFGMGLVFRLSFNGTPLPVIIGTGTVGGTAAPPAIGAGGTSGTGQAPVSYTVSLQPGQVVSALFSDVESLLGLSSGTVSGAIPAPAQNTLTDTLPFNLQNLSFTVSTGASGTSLTQLTAVLGTTQPVPLSVGSDTVTLESASVSVTYTPARNGVAASIAATIAATADFTSTFDLDGADAVTVVLGVDDADVSFYGAFTGSITVGDIATTLLRQTTGTALDGIAITSVSVSLDYDTSTSTFTDWSLACTIEDGSTVPIASATPAAQASVLVSSSGGQLQVLLSGSILLGDNLLQLMVDLSGQQQQSSVVITASWSQPPGAPGLTLLDVLQELGIGIASLPSGLDLSVVGISIGYATAPGVLAIDAVSGSGGQLLFVYRDSGTATDYGLLLEIPATVNLDDLPVVGATLSDLGTLTLGGMQFVAASAALATEAAVLNTLPAQAGLTGSLPQFPALPAGSTSAIVFMATLTSGTTPIPLTMALDGGTTTGGSTSTLVLPAAAGASGSAALPAATSSSSAPSVSWVNVQRAFGPVQVNRVGVAFGSGSSLEVALDASLSLAGLSVGLAGLGITVPLSAPFTPTFSLSGLQVDYSGGGLTIAGGMQTVTPGQEYDGELAISFGSFSAAAVGQYTVGPPASLFAYLFASAPVGGPPFFFITGLALGLGYNTALTIPPITGVSAYPLVQVAMGQESGDTLLNNISTLAPPSPGDDWLAVGVRFTSFETVSSFALLSVQWGTQVEIALLGESTLTVPPTPSGSSTGETIVAQAQLVLELTVQPDSGQFTLNAQLTPSSYVFDPAATLSGGFAWYQWWGPSPYAGDFVVTLGGYNPYWTPPSYYPTVPRLGLNWRIGAELTITGDLYFALTPSVVMAGGGLSATWQSGAITAWFDADADFLVRFKPFQYSADLSISIGVSVRLNLLVTHKTITIHVGVALALWGPPFGGTATVDLTIVKFTVRFGAAQPAQDPAISWQEFSQTFLPAAQSGQAGSSTLAAADDGTSTPTDTLVTTQVAAGLVGQSSAGTQVDPATLSLAIATQIPGNAATLPNDPSTPMPGVPATPLGIGPMNIPAATPDQGGVTVSLAVTTQRWDDDTGGWVADLTQWSATPVLGTAPAALWANTTGSLQNPALVQPVLTGVTLVPVVPPPAATQPVALAELLDADPPVETLSWSGATPPTSDDFDPSTAWSTLQSTLTQPAGPIPQSALLASLRAQGLTTAASVDVAAFAADAQELLTAPPALRLLGETR